MKIKYINHWSVLLFSTLLLGACGGLTQSDKPAISTWWLEPYESPVQTPPAGKLPRVLVEVTVVPGLDTDQILTLSENAELNHFAAARWADNLPELFSSLTRRTLQASGRFDVVSHGSGGPEDCNLHLDIQKFFVRNNGSETSTAAMVAVSGQLSCHSGETISIRSGTSIPVNVQQISRIVAAFQKATDTIMKDLLESIP